MLVHLIYAQKFDKTKLHGKWTFSKIEIFENGVLVETNEKDPENKCPTYVAFYSDGSASSFNFKDDCSLREKIEGTFVIKDGVLLVTENTGEEAINMKIITLKTDTIELHAKEEDHGVVYETKAYLIRYKI